jgi:hypothetical protein
VRQASNRKHPFNERQQMNWIVFLYAGNAHHEIIVAAKNEFEAKKLAEERLPNFIAYAASRV